MSAPGVELQKALYGVLNDPAGPLAGLDKVKVNGDLVIPVFDQVPTDVLKAFATGAGSTYVIVGPGREIPENAGETEDGDTYVSATRHHAEIQVFSQQLGFLEAKQLVSDIADAVVAAYRGGGFALPSHIIQALNPAGATYSRLEDMITSWGSTSVSVLTQPKS